MKRIRTFLVDIYTYNNMKKIINNALFKGLNFSPILKQLNMNDNNYSNIFVELDKMIYDSLGKDKESVDKFNKDVNKNIVPHLEDRFKKNFNKYDINIINTPTQEALFNKSLEFSIDNISTIRQEFLQGVKEKLRNLVLQGNYTNNNFKDYLKDRLSMSDKKVRMLALDQTHKITKGYVRSQMFSNGISEYIWKTSNDEAVRKAHRELNNKKFNINNPPVVNPKTGERGNPGDDYNCRCWEYFLI